MKWLALLMALSSPGACGDGGEPFCNVAKCADVCHDQLGCLSALAVGDEVHLFKPGAAQSRCGEVNAPRAAAEGRPADDRPRCARCWRLP